MFGIGTTEFLVILLVGVLVLGPEHLPKIMRTITKVMSDFRRVSTDFQRTINLEANQEEWQREQAAQKSRKKKKKTPKPAPAENGEGSSDSAAPDTTVPDIAMEDAPQAAETAQAPAADTAAQAAPDTQDAPDTQAASDTSVAPEAPAAPQTSADAGREKAAPAGQESGKNGLPSRKPGEPPLQGGSA